MSAGHGYHAAPDPGGVLRAGREQEGTWMDTAGYPPPRRGERLHCDTSVELGETVLLLVRTRAIVVRPLGFEMPFGSVGKVADPGVPTRPPGRRLSEMIQSARYAA